MGESVPGEVIGAFAGLAICAPAAYQIKAQISTPTKSPLPSRTWWLWAIGWFGLALLFILVPRSPEDKQIIDSPESPRSLGYFALLNCFLLQACWALDGVSPAAPASRKSRAVAQRLAPAAFGSVILLLLVKLVHTQWILSRPFYRLFLVSLAFLTATGYLTASLMAPYQLNQNQISGGGPEVAGLYWLPVIMQMLGLFTGIFSCTLIYTNPEWYGIALLGIFFAADGIYIGVGRFRLSGSSAQYGPLHS